MQQKFCATSKFNRVNVEEKLINESGSELEKLIAFASMVNSYLSLRKHFNIRIVFT